MNLKELMELATKYDGTLAMDTESKSGKIVVTVGYTDNTGNPINITRTINLDGSADLSQADFEEAYEGAELKTGDPALAKVEDILAEHGYKLGAEVTGDVGHSVAENYAIRNAEHTAKFNYGYNRDEIRLFTVEGTEYMQLLVTDLEGNDITKPKPDMQTGASEDSIDETQAIRDKYAKILAQIPVVVDEDGDENTYDVKTIEQLTAVLIGGENDDRAEGFSSYQIGVACADYLDKLQFVTDMEEPISELLMEKSPFPTIFTRAVIKGYTDLLNFAINVKDPDAELELVSDINDNEDLGFMDFLRLDTIKTKLEDSMVELARTVSTIAIMDEVDVATADLMLASQEIDSDFINEEGFSELNREGKVNLLIKYQVEQLVEYVMGIYTLVLQAVYYFNRDSYVMDEEQFISLLADIQNCVPVELANVVITGMFKRSASLSNGVLRESHLSNITAYSQEVLEKFEDTLQEMAEDNEPEEEEVTSDELSLTSFGDSEVGTVVTTALTDILLQDFEQPTSDVPEDLLEEYDALVQSWANASVSLLAEVTVRELSNVRDQEPIFVSNFGSKLMESFLFNEMLKAFNNFSFEEGWDSPRNIRETWDYATTTTTINANRFPRFKEELVEGGHDLTGAYEIVETATASAVEMCEDTSGNKPENKQEVIAMYVIALGISKTLDFLLDIIRASHIDSSEAEEQETTPEEGSIDIPTSAFDKAREQGEQAREAVIIKAYLENASLADIKAWYNLDSDGALYSILRKHRVPLRGAKDKESTALKGVAKNVAHVTSDEKLVQGVLNDYKNGVKLMDIYEKYDLYKNGLYYILDSYNVPRRKKR